MQHIIRLAKQGGTLQWTTRSPPASPLTVCRFDGAWACCQIHLRSVTQMVT